MLVTHACPPRPIGYLYKDSTKGDSCHLAPLTVSVSQTTNQTCWGEISVLVFVLRGLEGVSLSAQMETQVARKGDPVSGKG